MSAPDIDKLAAVAAKMRRPEIRMHPDAVQALGIANGCIADEDEEQLVEWVRPDGIAIIADASVEPGHMWLVDADPEPTTFLTPPPPPIEPDVIAAMDSLRDRCWTVLGLAGRAATRARWRRQGRR